MKRAGLALLAILFAAPANAQGNFPNPKFIQSWNNHGEFAIVPPYPGDHLKFLRGDGVWDTLGSADAPSGPTGYIQYNAGGSFGGIPLPPSGILKGGPGPSFLNAVAGTDYLAPNGNGSGLIGLIASQIGSVPAGLLKGSGGAFAAAVSGTDYAPATSGSGLLKGNGTGGTAAAAAADVAAVAGGSATPLIDGTAAIGTSNLYARQDHVHPTDTTRAPLASPGLTGTPTSPTAAVDTNTTQIASTAFVLGQAASATPLVDGAAAAGTSTRYARADHVHPTDTSRAPLASPTFTGTVTIPAGASISGFAPLASPALTGTPTLPTAAVDTNTTQGASTAFVLGQAASATPLIDGSAAAGTSTRYARADHVHPTDTSRAALASPTFTGTPAAPTAAVDTNTTQLATAAFVLGQAASASPLIDGTAAAGTSTRYARADHIHPTDTSRAATATTITPSGSITGGGDLSANRTLAYSGDGAWTSYTPTFDCVANSMTPGTVTAAYKLIGTKTAAVRINAAIITASTCVTPRITLPVAPAASQAFAGYDAGLGPAIIGNMPTAGSALMQFSKYDNSNPAANGAVLRINMVYETQ